MKEMLTNHMEIDFTNDGGDGVGHHIRCVFICSLLWVHHRRWILIL